MVTSTDFSSREDPGSVTSTHAAAMCAGKNVNAHKINIFLKKAKTNRKEYKMFPEHLRCAVLGSALAEIDLLWGQ